MTSPSSCENTIRQPSETHNVSPDIRSAAILISNLSFSRTVKNNFPLFKPFRHGMTKTVAQRTSPSPGH